VYTVHCTCTVHYVPTSGFWPSVRARALRASVFFSSLPHITGRCAPPAHCSFGASYSTPKNIYNLSNLGRPRQGLFSFHWTTEKYEDPCPSKYALIFWVCYFFYSFWIFSFCYSLLFLLSFSISSYSSLLISSCSSRSAILRLLLLLFLYFNCLLYYRHAY
jgi:hypothetical protein